MELDRDQLMLLMIALDKGTNIFGELPPEVRARLYAVVDNPTPETWENAYSIMISDAKFLTLWQACVRYGGYPVFSKPADGWTEVPTQAQLMAALEWAGWSPGNDPDSSHPPFHWERP